MSLIEAGMVQVLKDGFAALSQTAQANPIQPVLVESYGGQLDDDGMAWLRVLPACWVTFDHAKHKTQTRQTTRYDGVFYVMVAQRVLGPEPARRMGNGVELGTYDLIDLAKNMLARKDLGLPIGRLQPGDIKPIVQGHYNNQAIAVFSQAWHTWWVEKTPDPEADPPGVLESIGLQYLLKSGDDMPDAADEVTLS